MNRPLRLIPKPLRRCAVAVFALLALRPAELAGTDNPPADYPKLALQKTATFQLPFAVAWVPARKPNLVYCAIRDGLFAVHLPSGKKTRIATISGYCSALSLSPTGKTLVACTDKNAFILLRQPGDAEEWKIERQPFAWHDAAIAADDSYIAGYIPVFDAGPKIDIFWLKSGEVEHRNYPAMRNVNDNTPFLPAGDGGLIFVATGSGLDAKARLREQPVIGANYVYDVSAGPLPNHRFLRVFNNTTMTGEHQIATVIGTELFLESFESLPIRLRWKDSSRVSEAQIGAEGEIWLQLNKDWSEKNLTLHRYRIAPLAKPGK